MLFLLHALHPPPHMGVDQSTTKPQIIRTFHMCREHKDVEPCWLQRVPKFYY